MKFSKCLLFFVMLSVSSVYAGVYGGNPSEGYLYLFHDQSLEDEFFEGSANKPLLESQLYLGKMKNGVCIASGNFISNIKTRGYIDVDDLDVGYIYNLKSNNCVVSKIINHENGKCFLFGAKLIVRSNKAIAFEDKSIYHMHC